MTRPTSLDFTILGLIANNPLSGYGIRKVFETTAMGNFSTSPGTVYPALKRLQKLKLVESKKSEGKKGSVFHISPYGLFMLKEWLVRPLQESDIAKKRDEIILRFVFMDILSDHTKKIRFLETLRDLLVSYINQLKEYRQKEINTMPFHGLRAFEHGIASYQTTLNWCKKTLHTLNEQFS